MTPSLSLEPKIHSFVQRLNEESRCYVAKIGPHLPFRYENLSVAECIGVSIRLINIHPRRVSEQEGLVMLNVALKCIRVGHLSARE